MFESFASSIKKILPKEQGPLFLILILVLVFALYYYSNTKTGVYDSMDTGMNYPTGHNAAASMPSATNISAPMTSPTAQSAPITGAGFSLQPVANPADLLPSDQNSQWSSLNPSSMNKGDMLMPDLLQAGYHIGLDTIGQTLRNPNLQLRSDPIINKAMVGPWNQSTIEPDFARVPLELGN